MMDSLEYKRMTVEHLAYISRMKLLIHYSIIFFEDFPKNLTGDLKDQWVNGLQKMIDGLNKLKQENGPNTLNLDVDEVIQDAFIISYDSFINSKDSVDIAKCFNFNELIFSQALAMNYARIDAFYNDSIKCICELKPEIMIQSVDDNIKKNEGVNEKNITWQQIIKLGSYAKIMGYIKEDFIYKLGLKSLEKRINFLTSKLGFNISQENIDLTLLFEGEQYRHSIIHRGGIIDKRLLEITSKEKVEQGTKLQISQEYLRDIYGQSTKLINSISNQVEKKFFKV